MEGYLKPGLMQLLSNEPTTNVPTTKVDRFEPHVFKLEECVITFRNYG